VYVETTLGPYKVFINSKLVLDVASLKALLKRYKVIN
jgi:hypothetical protein